MLYYLFIHPLLSLGRFVLSHPVPSLSSGFVFAWLFAKYHKFRFIVRFTLFFLVVAISCAVGMCSVLLLYPLKLSKYCNYIVGQCARFLFPLLTGIEVQVANASRLKRSNRPCVFIANHQATLDLASMAACMPIDTFVLAKNDLKWVPFLGWYLNLSKNFFIQRNNTRSAIATMQYIAQLMKEQGASVYMFPEGTRSHQKDNSLLPFKKGAFHLAMQGGFDIVPIVSSTYHPIYDESIARFERGIVNVKICEPISVEGKSLEDVMKETKESMQKTLNEIRSIPLTYGSRESLVSKSDASTSPTRPLLLPPTPAAVAESRI